VSSLEDTWAPPGKYVELLLPFGYLSPQPEQQIDRFSRFQRAQSRVLSGTLANTIELVLPLATRVQTPNGKSIGSALFAQLTVGSTNGRPFPPELPFLWGI